MTSRSRTFHLTLPGTDDDIELEAHFFIDSFGSSDTYWEPGDPASISLEQVFRVEGDVETDVTDWAYATFYSWNVTAVRVPDYRPQTAMRKALFGQAYPPLPGNPQRFNAMVETFHTQLETVAEYVERIILENVHDYQDEEPDYDYSY